MWSRLRRRTFAPGRPAILPHQAGLVVFTVLALGAGIFAVVRYLL